MSNEDGHWNKIAPNSVKLETKESAHRKTGVISGRHAAKPVFRFDETTARSIPVACESQLVEISSLSDRLGKIDPSTILDPLTGLASKKMLEASLTVRLLEARHLKSNFGIALANIDSFKSFNEANGRQIGDRVLRMVAGAIAKSSRPFDVVGRWDSASFLVIMPVRRDSDLYAFSERTRANIAEMFLQINDQIVGVTISLGATRACRDDTLQKLVNRADLLLQQSKVSGRNKVTI